jgi:hypothetical protein
LSKPKLIKSCRVEEEEEEEEENYMEQSCYGKVKSFSSNQGTLHIILNQKVSCHIHKNPLPVPILILINPVHVLHITLFEDLF